VSKRKETDKPKVKAVLAVAEDNEDTTEATSVVPEKKKKRKLLGGKPAFDFDSIMGVSLTGRAHDKGWGLMRQAGEGIIPGFLSPVRPTGVTGAIPRAGLGSGATRPFGRFGA
jgi:hypothetical protein